MSYQEAAYKLHYLLVQAQQRHRPARQQPGPVQRQLPVLPVR